MCLANGKAQRPTIDEWVIGMAEHVSSRSSWPGTKVGCVVTRDGRIVSTGYNGTPRKWKDSESRDNKAVFCHAEENAIVNAARHGISLEGCTFYVTLSPCITCARMMVNVGAVEVIYAELWEGHDTMIDAVFEFADVKFGKAWWHGRNK